MDESLRKPTPRERLAAARAAAREAAGESAAAQPQSQPQPQPQRRDLPSTEIRQAAFLIAFVQAGGVVSRAAELCGIPKDNHYRWLREDETYRPRVESAIEEANDAIETEIIRRGQHGYDEPIVYQGKISINPETGKPLCVRKYDTTLLIFLAKAKMPEKYRERTETQLTGLLTHDHAIAGGVSIAAVRQSYLEDPEFIEFQRWRALQQDRNGSAGLRPDQLTGPVRPDGERGPLENGPAPGSS